MSKSAEANKMRELRVEKLTVNIGVGQAGPQLENAKSLLTRLTGRVPIATTARARNPVFKIRKGDAIGAKVTLRGRSALEFLERAFDCIDRRLPASSFDRSGNFSFGVKEYIDFPGMKYDPKLGMLGFDVCITLARPGMRVQARRRARGSIGSSHRITREEAMEYVKRAFKVELT